MCRQNLIFVWVELKAGDVLARENICRTGTARINSS